MRPALRNFGVMCFGFGVSGSGHLASVLVVWAGGIPEGIRISQSKVRSIESMMALVKRVKRCRTPTTNPTHIIPTTNPTLDPISAIRVVTVVCNNHKHLALAARDIKCLNEAAYVAFVHTFIVQALDVDAVAAWAAAAALAWAWRGPKWRGLGVGLGRLGLGLLL